MNTAKSHDGYDMVGLSTVAALEASLMGRIHHCAVHSCSAQLKCTGVVHSCISFPLSVAGPQQMFYSGAQAALELGVILPQSVGPAVTNACQHTESII